MGDEDSAGASYLASLKRSAPQGAAAAPAPDSSPSSPSPISAGATSLKAKVPASERRRSPRYRCQGSAHLRDLAKGIGTWATFTDISMHGCYVEAMSTFRAGAPLTLTIEVNGFRVESKGEVRVVYPNLGMGICFTTMSEADRERLGELVQSLSRPSLLLGQRGAAGITSSSAISVENPAAVLKAVMSFFDERHILTRDEFLRILTKHQRAGG